MTTSHHVLMEISSACEWLGCVLGLLGAFLLATHTRISRFGWVAFFGANVAMIVFALGINAHGLLLQQIGFALTSCLGLYRTGLWPFQLKARGRR